MQECKEVPMQGLFELKTAQDLLGKLRHDYYRPMSDPAKPYIAFDFFVTARHIPDWLYPGNTTAQRQLFDQNLLLQVCRHIADGSKHLEATAKQHTTVKDTACTDVAFQPDAFQSPGFQVGRLIVLLDGAAAVQFGASMEVMTLATSLLTFWETHPDLQ
jgi:hypothetical protein